MIEIKQKHLRVVALCCLYEMVVEDNLQNPKEEHLTKEYRAVDSIIKEVMLIFQNKMISKVDSEKPFKIKLTYHQAYFIAIFGFTNIHRLYGIEETRVRMLMSDIDEKL